MFSVWKVVLQSAPSCNPETFGTSEVAEVAEFAEEEVEAEVGFVVAVV